jgi:hypothetical protein
MWIVQTLDRAMGKKRQREMIKPVRDGQPLDFFVWAEIAERFFDALYLLDVIAAGARRDFKLEFGAVLKRSSAPPARSSSTPASTQDVVRIAVDEIGRRTARMVPVADGIDLVDIVSHECPPSLASWPDLFRPTTP